MERGERTTGVSQRRRASSAETAIFGGARYLSVGMQSIAAGRGKRDRDRERMAEHRDVNRAIAYGDRMVENEPILMQGFSDMVRSVRGRLVFSLCSLSSVGHQGKSLSVVSHT